MKQAPEEVRRVLLSAPDIQCQSQLHWGQNICKTITAALEGDPPPAWPSFPSFVYFSILHYVFLFLSLSVASDAQADAVQHPAQWSSSDERTTMRVSGIFNAGSKNWEPPISNPVTVPIAQFLLVCKSVFRPSPILHLPLDGRMIRAANLMHLSGRKGVLLPFLSATVKLPCKLRWKIPAVSACLQSAQYP